MKLRPGRDDLFPPPAADRQRHLPTGRRRCGLALAARSLALVIAALVLQPGAARAEEPRLRLASDTWPPFTAELGQRRFAVDLVHEALERAGYAATTTINQWDAVTAGMRTAMYDGSAAVWHSAEREAFLVFSEPYLENRLILVGRKGSDVSAGALDDLEGQRVAVVGRYAYGEAVEQATSVELIDGRSDQENLEKLLSGHVDYMLVDELVARYLVEHQGAEASRYLEIGTTPLARRPLHFALRRDLAGAETIIERFNAEIRKMVADGTYNRILQLNWIRADVDGDGTLELVAVGDAAGTAPPASGFDVFPRSPSAGGGEGPDRYCLNGKIYDGWEAVPDQYKVAPSGVMDVTPKGGVSMFSF